MPSQPTHPRLQGDESLADLIQGRRTLPTTLASDPVLLGLRLGNFIWDALNGTCDVPKPTDRRAADMAKRDADGTHA